MQAGVCWALAALLAVWTLAKERDPACPKTSLAWVIDRCRAPLFYAIGCSGGDLGESLRYKPSPGSIL